MGCKNPTCFCTGKCKDQPPFGEPLSEEGKKCIEDFIEARRKEREQDKPRGWIPEPLLPLQPIQPVQGGWQCPFCKTVYAPMISSCHCQQISIITCEVKA